MEQGFTPDGYYVACVNGIWITFVSYEEYLDYISSDKEEAV